MAGVGKPLTLTLNPTHPTNGAKELGHVGGGAHAHEALLDGRLVRGSQQVEVHLIQSLTPHYLYMRCKIKVNAFQGKATPGTLIQRSTTCYLYMWHRIKV